MPEVVLLALDEGAVLGLTAMTSDVNPLLVPPPKINDWLSKVAPAASCNATGRLPTLWYTPDGTDISDSVVSEDPDSPPAINILPVPNEDGAGTANSRWIGNGTFHGSWPASKAGICDVCVS